MSTLRNLFGLWMDKMLLYKRNNCNELVVIAELNGVASLCKLLTCLATSTDGVCRTSDWYCFSTFCSSVYSALFSACAFFDVIGIFMLVDWFSFLVICRICLYVRCFSYYANCYLLMLSVDQHNCVLSERDASVDHASGSGQLQANPHVAGPWLSPGKPTRRAVTTMGSNDLVVGEDHMLGPSCQRYNWQTGRCGSMAFGSSPRRGKTLISNPRCLAEVSTRGRDFRK